MGRFLLVVALLGCAFPALAHEVRHEVRWGKAVAVRAWYPGGKSLSSVDAEVFSPADPAVPRWKGRTDPNGWLAFVPDVPGRWRVRIIDPSGHGLDTAVEVPAPDAPAEGTPAGTEPSPLASAIRSVLGVAVIAGIFAILVLLVRRMTR